MMQVHLYHDEPMNNYILTLINPTLKRGWHVWESASNGYEGAWARFEEYFDELSMGRSGWRFEEENWEKGQCIYQGSDVKEALQAARCYKEYL